MTIDFVDSSGRPRPEAEIEQALDWVKKRIVRPDFSDPEGVILCVTIKDALEELLRIRAFLDKAKAESSVSLMGPVEKCEHAWGPPSCTTGQKTCQKCLATFFHGGEIMSHDSNEGANTNEPD